MLAVAHQMSRLTSFRVSHRFHLLREPGSIFEIENGRPVRETPGNAPIPGPPGYAGKNNPTDFR